MLWALAAMAIAAGTSTDQAVRVHRLDSKHQEGPTEVRVLAPRAVEEGKQYPALYVLPVEAGRGSRYGDGLEECRRLGVADRYGVFVVAPTFFRLPWYADHPHNRRIAQETYFIDEVLPLVEANYPVEASVRGRYLVGFSKSGWGAFSLLLRHQELFAKAAAWDAPLMLDHPGPYGSLPIFGAQENFEGYRLTRLLEASRSRLGPEVRLIHLGYGNFRQEHIAFHRQMHELGVAHRYCDGPPRQHTWHSGWLAQAVALLFAGELARGN